MSAPLVLITSIPRSIPTTLPGTMDNATINQRLGSFVAEAGGIPIASDAWSDPAALVERIDAVVLNGGSDLDPATYGAEPDPATDEPNPRRDEFELKLASTAIELGLPLLGICRGMQTINVALGGTLVQHLDAVSDVRHYVREPWDSPVHEVEFEAGSALREAMGREAMGVNSVHHQGIDRVGDGLRVVARAPDGTIEAIADEGRSILGVQWHPEFMAEEWIADHAPIFRAALRSCVPDRAP